MNSTAPIHLALTTKYVQNLLNAKARQLMRRPEFQMATPADIVHDLIKHILEQVDNYDPARSAPNTFITCVVETTVAMLVRSRKRHKRAIGYQSISLERAQFNTEQRNTVLGEIISECDLRRRCGGDIHDGQRNAELSADVATAIESLTARQQKIASGLISGSEVSVAREMNISRRQLRKEIMFIRRHFKRLELEKYQENRTGRI